jgi:cytosine/adenosine deaminase-related metal-dependent hydrolase
MAATLVRSRAMITKTLSATAWEEIADGALIQEDGVITETGSYDDLHRKYPTLPVLGSGKEIMLPGFVNGHHHVGLTPVQLGSPRYAAGALVRHPHGGAQSERLSRHALFSL